LEPGELTRESELPLASSQPRRGLYVIGLTGNIATGKTAVAEMLAQLGARVIDADALAHQVMRAGTPAWHQVVEQFGRDILQENGEIDRTQLGARVFADPAAMARLEAIVHPAVIAEAESRLQAMQSVLYPASRAGKDRSAPAPEATRMSVLDPASDVQQVAVLEAIKLLESGMHHRCDALWVVTSPREQQVQRLMETRGLSQSEAELRIDAQSPQADKVALANVVIDNSGDLEDTRAQVRREWEHIVQGRQYAAAQKGTAKRGIMSLLRDWMESHPSLSMWSILAIGMVAIFLISARDGNWLATQRLFMAVACVLLAGLCTWVVSWE